MKNKITVFVGISGSGKSTLAHKMWEKNPKGSIIISRDKVRELIFGYSENNIFEYYNRKDIVGREKTVTDYIDTLIRFALNSKKHVILDSTHLKHKYISAYSKFAADIDLVIVKTPIEIAIERDQDRSRTVGTDVIKRQFNQLNTLLKQLDIDVSKGNVIYTDIYLEQKILDNQLMLPDCVVVDIDGTIAEKGGRNPFDWKAVGEDKPIQEVIDVVKALQRDGKSIVICTGRDGVCEKETKEWLDLHNITYDDFYIRKQGDSRADFIVKEEMWKQISKDFYITLMIDDRWQVVKHARDLGYTVMDCAFNTF